MNRPKKAPRDPHDPQCHVSQGASPAQLQEIRRNVCCHLPLEKHDFFEEYYCLFHLPTQDKNIRLFEKLFREKVEAINKKIAQSKAGSKSERIEKSVPGWYDFRYIWFPSAVNFFHLIFDVLVDFSFAHFAEDADFGVATFKQRALFNSAVFWRGSNFGITSFGAAEFQSATFNMRANFSESDFTDKASFRSATFSSDADFRDTHFRAGVNFEDATFGGHVEFGRTGFTKGLDLRHARFARPDLVTFYRVELLPQWFINVDSRYVVFSDVKWAYTRKHLSSVSSTLENLKATYNEPGRLLEIAYRQLAVNAEDNNRYEEAASFRYLAMETKRLEFRWRGRGWTLNWWYRLSSGYGEDWKRAALVLLTLLIAFGVLFASPLAKFDYGTVKPATTVITMTGPGPLLNDQNQLTYTRRMGLLNGEGVVHSIYVAALQRPDPKPADNRTKFFVILETIFGPVQAALLALAIRRKFMR
jgi:uncharacterized protein YjbI with pentapeptide repeats